MADKIIKTKVEIDLTGVLDTIGARGLAHGLRACAQQVAQTSNPYIPMRKGALRQSVAVIERGDFAIEWRTPYARRHYHNQYVNYTTPGTGPRWVEAAAAKHGETWAQAFLGGMLRG